MATTVIQLGLEGRALRGIRLENDGEDTKCADAACWSFEGESSDAGDSRGADLPAQQDDASLADGESGEEYAGNPQEDALCEAAKFYRTREVSLALPLSLLFVKVLRIPIERREDLEEAIDEVMRTHSPFPDENLKFGWEIVRETEKDIFVIAAALPEAQTAEIGASLAAAKLSVVRTDISALGWMWHLWAQVTAKTGVGRRLVMFDLDDNGWELVVLDDDAPAVLRGLGADVGGDLTRLRREITLSLMEAEQVSGTREVGEVIVGTKAALSDEMAAVLAEFGEIRKLEIVEESGGVEGCARREGEACTFNATPFAWDDALREGRFKRRLHLSVAVAFGIWALAAVAAIGGLFVVDAMTKRMLGKSKQHQRAYKQVSDMRDRVELVKRYSDHDRGVLEIMKAISDRLPEGITLTSFQYRRDEGVKISGEAEQPTMVYDFKNALVKSEVFATVSLRGPQASRGVQKFDIETAFESKEEDK